MISIDEFFVLLPLPITFVAFTAVITSFFIGPDTLRDNPNIYFTITLSFLFRYFIFSRFNLKF